jgi:hypothetical protein
MAKKKKTKKEEVKKDQPLQQPKKLTIEDKKKAIEKMNKLSNEQVLKLEDDAIVTIPISGFFKRSVEGVMFYLLEDLNASQIITVMNNIKTGFEKVDPETVTNKDRALWCIMTLLSEIHWQADDQDKYTKSEEKVGNALTAILNGVGGATEHLATSIENAVKKGKTTED